MEHYQVEEREEHAASGSDIREYKGFWKRAVALHMAKKRERHQRCAARKAMMIDLMKKKAGGFVTKLENRQAGHAYQVDTNMGSRKVPYEEIPPPYEEMPPPYEAVVNTEPITKAGWAKMETA